MAKSNNGQILTITLRGTEVPIERKMVRIADLSYYAENPRVYSLVRPNSGEPDQDEIETVLTKMEHVKRLIQAIQANGGLTDPLLVRGSDNAVIEGNSRLAAYRALAGKDPVAWGEVKCDIVPANITDEQVFTLLVQYHIIGRKDWDPFEQAGLFWRRYDDGATAAEIAEEMSHMGLSTKKVHSMINVYSFMVEKEDTDPNRWSYYDEYLKSRAIQRVREEYPEFDDVVVDKIKSGEITKAVEVREKVRTIAQAGGKTLTTFIRTPRSLNKCHERAVARGSNNVLLKRLKKFRDIVSDPETKKDLQRIPDNQQKKCLYELQQIDKAIGRLRKVFGDEDSA